MFVFLSAAHKIPHRSTLSALQITSATWHRSKYNTGHIHIYLVHRLHKMVCITRGLRRQTKISIKKKIILSLLCNLHIVREFVCTSSALPLSESVFELGLVDGDSEGETLDKLLGESLDEFDGEALDELDGIILVEELGKSEGRADEKLDVAGDAVGSAEIVGDGVGLSDGICDGSSRDSKVGASVGALGFGRVGNGVGGNVGNFVGIRSIGVNILVGFIV